MINTEDRFDNNEIVIRSIHSKQPEKVPAIAAAALSSYVAAMVYNSTLSTIPHEYGHVAAIYMTREVPKDAPPRVQITAKDKFNQFLKTGSIKDFFNFLILGKGGSTSYRVTELNPLGQVLTKPGTEAFTSIAGSIPALTLDTATVVGGVALSKKYPVIGGALITFGTVDHLLNLQYPISAAFMSKKAMKAEASTGHDFANFSLKVGEMTGLSPRLVAFSTAAAYTGIVPLAGILTYMFMKNQEFDVVSDQIAIQHWLSKVSADPNAFNLYSEFYDTYPRKAKNEQAISLYQKNKNENTERVMLDELSLLHEYLAEKLPKKVIKGEKKEIYKLWNKSQKSDKVQLGISAVQILGGVAETAGSILKTLGQTIAPSVAQAATVFSYASPFMQGITVISNSYDMVKDLQAPSATIPKAAKMLSVAKLIVSFVASALIITGFFVPGLNAFVITGVVLGAISAIILSYARYKVIKTQFQLHQATDPDQMKLMIHRLKLLKKLYSIEKIDISFLKRHCKDMAVWYKQVRCAKKFEFMTKEEEALYKEFKSLLSH